MKIMVMKRNIKEFHEKFNQSKKGGAQPWELFIFSFLKRFGVYKFIIYVHEIHSNKTYLDVITNNNELQFFILDKNNTEKLSLVKRFVEDNTWHDNTDFIHKRLQDGDKCFFICSNIKKAEVLGYIWLKQSAYISYKGYNFALSKTDAYTFDGIISPSYRGNSILGKIYNFIFNWSQQNNMQKIYTIIDYDNYPSIRGNLKLGAKKFLSITSIPFNNGRIWYIK